MSVKQDLLDRSGSACELCASPESPGFYNLPPAFTESMDESIVVCPTCKSQIENPEEMDEHHIAWAHWNYKNDFPIVDAETLEPITQLTNILIQK